MTQQTLALGTARSPLSVAYGVGVDSTLPSMLTPYQFTQIWVKEAHSVLCIFLRLRGTLVRQISGDTFRVANNYLTPYSPYTHDHPTKRNPRT